MSKPYKGNKLRAWDYWAQCDECGQPFYASTMKIRWDGALVDTECWEPYHEGNKSKVVRERRNVPIARPYKLNPTDNQLAHDPVTDPDDINWYVVTDN